MYAIQKGSTMKKILLVGLAAVSLLGVVTAPLASSAEDHAPSQASVLSSIAQAPSRDHAGQPGEQRRISGVAKALHAGFKAASAYKAAGQVLGWAGILGHSDGIDLDAEQIESVYFGR